MNFNTSLSSYTAHLLVLTIKISWFESNNDCFRSHEVFKFFFSHEKCEKNSIFFFSVCVEKEQNEVFFFERIRLHSWSVQVYRIHMEQIVESHVTVDDNGNSTILFQFQSFFLNVILVLKRQHFSNKFFHEFLFLNFKYLFNARYSVSTCIAFLRKEENILLILSKGTW